jgi:hypothetical protein
MVLYIFDVSHGLSAQEQSLSFKRKMLQKTIHFSQRHQTQNNSEITEDYSARQELNAYIRLYFVNGMWSYENALSVEPFTTRSPKLLCSNSLTTKECEDLSCIK